MDHDATPRAEVDVDAALVRALLADQHPDLAELPLAPPMVGWDNLTFRLGDDLAVRMPRRQMAVPLALHEQHWLPQLAPSLPLPVPVPLRTGRPGRGYPWVWTICPWLHGAAAAIEPPSDPDDAATTLGRFLRALHRPAPADAPVNPYRGVPLAARAPALLDRLDALDGMVDGSAVLATWQRLVETPPWNGPRVWLHGDLHPANVLVHDGKISAIIDFGDITAGDPATDLAVAWMLLPHPSRSVLRAEAGEIDDDTWDRARGWALALGMAIASPERTAMAQVGWATVDAVLTDS